MLNKLSRNEACWCGSGQKYKKCHAILDERIISYAAKGYEIPERSLLKNPKQIEGIRESSKLNIVLLDYIEDFVVEGVTTEELDRLIYNKTKELGGIPATLNYKGFQKSVCISINEVVCHGIPLSRVRLQNGDIVNIDISTLYRGYYSDSSRMFCIGGVSDEKRKLVEVAKECTELGIRQVKPWGFLGDVGQAVNDHAKKNGYSVVKEIGGHGIGEKFQEDPWVSYVSKRGTGMLLVPGLVFTVEPMINMGKANIVLDQKDGWTVYTADGKPSAQWEKTVLVTDTGCEVLTY
ncbi:methionine aminopeptidase, type I [Desulfitobacterium dehalogenans ATCC 51507]|uniref:Methionine aminopeptidase n=1 Tax=Desulfitobacterium dehalogenans (strain ATCC 51507 / DSM 9161 / JW/IU-DC1) TaxID=756499 RepID=I4AB78_DESDJ|nr:methionyl aminopeptidase [Desulfitobacterium dehalogenans]AFM01213.1 methionine aminopeptidase, type I [Desulfitobacterium dehalogenans ATCC 51507]